MRMSGLMVVSVALAMASGVVLWSAYVAPANAEAKTTALFGPWGTTPDGGIIPSPSPFEHADKPPAWDNASDEVYCDHPRFQEPVSSGPAASVALFTVVPGSDGCNATQNTQSTMCGGYANAANVTVNSKSKSCVTLTCGTTNQQFVTNYTEQKYNYLDRVCHCKNRPNDPPWCVYGLRSYIKQEQIWAYIPLGNNHYRCKVGTTINLNDIEECTGGQGTMSVVSLSDGPNSCSWLALSGSMSECATYDGQVSCSALSSASTSCSTGVQPPAAPSNDCLTAIINKLNNNEDCWTMP